MSDGVIGEASRRVRILFIISRLQQDARGRNILFWCDMFGEKKKKKREILPNGYYIITNNGNSCSALHSANLYV